MNKVLQAAGRVIRDAEDKGFVLLLDERFELPVSSVSFRRIGWRIERQTPMNNSFNK